MLFKEAPEAPHCRILIKPHGVIKLRKLHSKCVGGKNLAKNIRKLNQCASQEGIRQLWCKQENGKKSQKPPLDAALSEDKKGKNVL